VIIFIYFTSIAIILCIFARLNLYLFYASLTSLVISTIAIMQLQEERTLLIFGTLATLTILYIYYNYSIKILVKNYNKLTIDNYSYRKEIIISIILIGIIYLILAEQIFERPWWLDIENRKLYITENSRFLRGVKLTPILIIAILFFNKEKINKVKFISIISLTILFSLFLGSKSGFIYLFSSIAFYISLTNNKLSKYIKELFILISLSIMSVLYFFYELSASTGETLKDIITSRFDSDILGYKRLFEHPYNEICQNFNFTSPFINNFYKLVGENREILEHLTMGNCLASPLDPLYSFELLTPFFFEYYLKYGEILAFIALILLPIALIIIQKIIYLLGKILEIKYLAFCASIFIMSTTISIFFGGKLINFIISDIYSIVAFMFVCGIIKKLIKLIKPNKNYKNIK
jgi:hypothetical protein